MRKLAALCLLVASSATSALDFDDAWIREAPPGAEVLAGYVEIRNDDKSDVELTGVRSDAFGEVELHEMSMTDGTMKMRALDALRIPAGSAVQLKPGGIHMMLHDPAKPLRAGDQVAIEFEDTQGKHSIVKFTVRASSK